MINRRTFLVGTLGAGIAGAVEVTGVHHRAIENITSGVLTTQTVIGGKLFPF